MSSKIRHCMLFISAACVIIPMTANAHEISAPATAAQMVRAANTLLNALSPEQKKSALWAFEDEKRFDWHYVPRSRVGLSLKDMTEDQRQLALQFLKVGLSQGGYIKATNIMALEAVLREIETFNWLGRDPQKYFFSFFGQPSDTNTWGWRVEGHHLSLNITIVKGHLFAAAPRFLGANPAEVAEGVMRGVRTLSNEEIMARKLVKSLDQKQQDKAIFRNRAYRDIVTGNDEKVSPLDLVGISAGDLNPAQMELLIRLIDEYVSTMPPEFARQRLDAIRQSGLNHIYFGWAGL